MSINDELNLYQNRTRQSKQWFERACKVMPGGVSHEIRAYPPHPFLVRSSAGAYLTDIDGNRYIDYWMGHYSHLLGHNPDIIAAAVRDRIDEGIMWGSLHPTEIELAELITTMVPSAEEIRFCTTGTEATMFAVRLARGFTGKNRIFKIAGGWHGPSSELFHAVSVNFDRAESLGLPREDDAPIKSIPFNDLEGCRRIFHEGDLSDLAAVIVEPMLGSSWFIAANREYLQMLRDECDRLGAVLIFDEIITGFRVAAGGAQEYYGILPDLTTMGKVMGAGMPIAAVAGRRAIMERCNPASGLQKWERVRIGGGTFSCHPLSMASSLTLLRYIASNRDRLYPDLEHRGNDFREQIKNIFEGYGIPIAVTGLGSLYTIHFLRQAGESAPQNPGEALGKCYFGFKERLFKILLMNRGIYVMHGGGALSTAHSTDEVDVTMTAMDDIARMLADDPGVIQKA